MKLTLFGKVNVDEKAKSPTSPTKKATLQLLTIAMLLLSQISPIDRERDKKHPRINQERDNDDGNLRMLAENSAQMKEKKDDDSCCKHSIIGEFQCNQMRSFLADEW